MKLTITEKNGTKYSCAGDEAIERIRAIWADVDRKITNGIKPDPDNDCLLTITELDWEAKDRHAWNGINLLGGEYGAKYGYRVKIVNK